MLKLFDNKISKNEELKYRLVIFPVIALFYLLFLGNVHLFDWDEINFAEAAREMIVTGDYLNVRIDFQPFHEKPPLFIWMQVISMKIFGINETAARFPNVIIGLFTIYFLIKIGKKVYDNRFAYLWALAYFGSILPFFYFKSSIIDPSFNLFMFAGVFYLFSFSEKKINQNISIKKDIILAGIFTSLAFLTKGPVGFMLVFITWAVFWLINFRTFRLPLREILLFTMISFLPAVIWYAAIFSEQGGGLISDFIKYQIRLLTTGDAGHKGPFFYHFVVVFLGCFPASVFAIFAFRKNELDDNRQKLYKQFNIILLAVVLVIFSIVKTKIVHYSSLSYFPVTFLAAYTMYKLLSGELKRSRLLSIAITAFGIILTILFVSFPLILMNIESFLPKITDKFTNALLQADVHWSGFELIVGFTVLVGTILFHYFNKKQNILKSFLSIFISTAITIFLFMTIMAPKVESYTQRTPIEFFKSLEGKDVYVHSLSYKSYAPYFYQKKEFKNSKFYLKLSNKEYEEFLLIGDIDKPAYFSTKINKVDKYFEIQPHLKELYRKNGFVFLMRESNK